MDDEIRNDPPGKPIAIDAPVSRNKTLRVKLATSLRRQAELVARGQGVSLSYLVNKAIEEKIARFKSMKENQPGGRDSVHLVEKIRKSG
ncbi:hypothetical protein [Terriglobus roseus]|uniref:Uncharacterized protein n=1 Tax=Terriglobus roseus TaxID=392734 RepID=A0A1H4Q446_9BACT|nr:hypothetical protein [Terriglobus roseus]SEC14371.1 hypothetical protein SAMN05443244_2761 [Terriglobus roseus]